MLALFMQCNSGPRADRRVANHSQNDRNNLPEDLIFCKMADLIFG